jgi:hypothetical protein
MACTENEPYSITYAERAPNTARHARIEERKGYKDTQKTSKGTQKSRPLSEAVLSDAVGVDLWHLLESLLLRRNAAASRALILRGW